MTTKTPKTPKTPKILHEEDGFVLVGVDETHATGAWNSWIWHRCDGEKPWGPPNGGIRWCDVMIDGNCRYCETMIPDEIYGLWKLHNFDRIQKGGRDEHF